MSLIYVIAYSKNNVFTSNFFLPAKKICIVIYVRLSSYSNVFKIIKDCVQVLSL